MPWFKVDDGFYTSKKVLSIPRAQRLSAVGLWTMAGNWSARELSDGVVHKYVLDELGATPKLRQALIEARLWLDRGSGDIEFHDWAQYQPTRAEVEAAREKERIRKANYRSSHRDTQGTDGGTPAGRDPESQGVSGHPDPTRPDPSLNHSSTKSEAAVRGTRISKRFALTDEMRAWGAENTPLVDLDAKLPEFIDYWTGVPGQKGLKSDWVGTWRNGMRKQQEFAERNRKAAPLVAVTADNEWLFNR